METIPPIEEKLPPCVLKIKLQMWQTLFQRKQINVYCPYLSNRTSNRRKITYNVLKIERRKP